MAAKKLEYNKYPPTKNNKNTAMISKYGKLLNGSVNSAAKSLATPDPDSAT